MGYPPPFQYIPDLDPRWFRRLSTPERGASPFGRWRREGPVPGRRGLPRCTRHPALPPIQQDTRCPPRRGSAPHGSHTPSPSRCLLTAPLPTDTKSGPLDTHEPPFEVCPSLPRHTPSLCPGTRCKSGWGSPTQSCPSGAASSGTDLPQAPTGSDMMEQGPTEPHAARGTLLLSSGGAGGGYY